MKGKISFNPNALHHIYTISEDGGVIFYSDFDYLVFFSILCTSARKYGVTIVCISIMRNHIHLGILSNDRDTVTGFMKSVIGTFVKEYNSRNGSYRLKFRRSFGMADKSNDRDKRSCIIYIANNGVEKRAARAAIDHKWNFLRYMDSPNPFSQKLVKRRISPALSSALSAVRTAFSTGHFIRYSFFEIVFYNLSSTEKKQLTDFIVQTYNVISYKSAISLFKSPNDMLIAMDASTGKEFDVVEEHVYEDYRNYDSMLSLAMRNNLLGKAGQLICGDDSVPAVSNMLRYHTFSSELEIRRFLHCF